MMMFRFSDSLFSCTAFLQRATGWRRAGLAFVFGSVLALSMPPFDVFPLLWLCLPALIFLLQGTVTQKQAFVTGWCFAFGFFVFGLYWIAMSMLVDIAQFWWAVPLSVAGLPAFFAIFYGIAAVIARKLGLSGLRGALAFGLLWFLADYARGHMFTGFPWNLTGYAWSGVLPVLQITSIVGIYGLTLLTTVAACLPAALEVSMNRFLPFLHPHPNPSPSRGGRGALPRRVFVGSLVLFAALTISGEARLRSVIVGTVPDVRVRLVQPNIAQAQKWRIGEREGHFEKLIDLSSAPGDKPVTHVFWPETASTFYLSEDAFHRQQIADHIPAAATVITGVIRRDLDPEGKTRFYNSLVAVDGLGRLVAGYDKSHLVPFGEYMPWRKYIPLRTLAASGADFTAGPGVHSLRVLGLPLFSPLICYEAIFPGEVTDRDDRPAFMVNLTNDGWYGHTTGPYQHFAIVRVRAIEEGLPLLRIANTGISGVIDPLGHVIHRLGLGKEGFIDSDLPTPLPPTWFSRVGEIPLWVAFFLLAMGLALSCRPGKIK